MKQRKLSRDIFGLALMAVGMAATGCEQSPTDRSMSEEEIAARAEFNKAQDEHKREFLLEKTNSVARGYARKKIGAIRESRVSTTRNSHIDDQIVKAEKEGVYEKAFARGYDGPPSYTRIENVVENLNGLAVSPQMIELVPLDPISFEEAALLFRRGMGEGVVDDSEADRYTQEPPLVWHRYGVVRFGILEDNIVLIRVYLEEPSIAGSDASTNENDLPVEARKPTLS